LGNETHTVVEAQLNWCEVREVDNDDDDDDADDGNVSMKIKKELVY